MSNALIAVFTNVAGWMADALISRSALSLTAVRKLMEGLSCFGAAACLLLLALLPQVLTLSAFIGHVLFAGFSCPSHKSLPSMTASRVRQ